MKTFVKAISILLMVIGIVSAIPRVGSDCPDFDMYLYSTQQDWNFYENHPIGKKVTVFITGSIC